MVRVNGIAVSDSEPVLELEPRRLFVPTGIFRLGRLRLPAERPTHVSAVGLDYYPLDSIAGVHYAVDPGTQTLDITVPASAFTGTLVDGLDNVRTVATRPDPGLFLNHDFQILHSGAQETLSGLLEGGFFSRLGVLTEWEGIVQNRSAVPSINTSTTSPGVPRARGRDRFVSCSPTT